MLNHIVRVTVTWPNGSIEKIKAICVEETDATIKVQWNGGNDTMKFRKDDPMKRVEIVTFAKV